MPMKLNISRKPDEVENHNNNNNNNNNIVVVNLEQGFVCQE